MHGIETTNTRGTDSCLGTTGYNGICLTQANQVEGVSQCITGRSTCRRGDVVGTMETIHNGNLAGSNVSNHLRNEERIELRTVCLVNTIIHHFLFKSLNATDSYAKDNTNAVLVNSFQIHAAVLNSLFGCYQGQLSVTVHLTGLFAVNIVVYVEVLHLAGKLSLEF